MFIYELFTKHPFLAIDSRGWLGLSFGIIFSSAMGYYLFEWGLKRIDVQEVGIFTYIDPITAALFAYILLGEVITPVFLLGTVMVFGGIYLAEGRLHWHPLHKLHLQNR